MNGGRQAPIAMLLPTMERITSGVMIAPIAPPLCSRLLPSSRSFRDRTAWVVRRAQGQCPASKNPSSVRQTSIEPYPLDSPVSRPTADQPMTTAG